MIGKSINARRTALGAALLVFAAIGAARATTIHGPANIEALTETADAVVRAKVTARTSHWGNGGEKSGVIFTEFELTPSEQWKGESVGPKLSVRSPGGQVGDLVQEVIGSAQLEVGDEAVLFLKLRVRGDGTRLPIYEVSHWALGKFVVSPPGKNSLQHAIRDRSGVECIGCGANESDRISLEELRARVQAAATKSNKDKPDNKPVNHPAVKP